MKRILTLLLVLLCCAAFASAITINTASLPVGQIGVLYFQPLSASGASGTPLWSVTSGSLPPGVVLDQIRGNICSGTQNTDTTASCTTTPQTSGTFIFTLQVVDSQNSDNVTSKQFSLTIQGSGSPSITSVSPLPNGGTGQAYVFQFQETGGQAPFTWLEFTSSNTFPPGFTLDPASGVFSTPAASTPGTYFFGIQVRDATGLASSPKQFTLTIGQGFSITNASPLPSGSIGVSYGVQLGVSGGVGPFSWTLISGALPSGLSLSTSGFIFGTPNLGGQAGFTVQVQDFGTSGVPITSKFFLLSVSASNLSIVQTTLPFAVQNQAYSTQLTATGGSAPYFWSLGATGVSGLTIDPNSGLLSGTPINPSGTYSVQVNVRDSAGGTATANFTLSIASNLSITTTTLPNASVGQSYSSAVSASGGQAPYTWSIASGSLPNGLSLISSSGSSITISGSPTANGTFQFTIKVVDTGGRSATQALSILVGTPISISTTTLPPGSQGVSYTASLGATGGQTPYTWTISGGSLPTGLALNTNPDFTATITGNPSGQGASTFQVQVKDSQSNVATQTYTINIGVPLTITTVTVGNGTVGSAYSQPLGANGGTPPYNWSVVNGTLPPGVTLSSTNGLLNGTPSTPGNYNFTVQVADSTTATAQRAFSITVISTLTLQTGNVSGTVGAALSFTLAASGGVPPYSYSIRSGSQPSGVNFNGTTGQFAGTPTSSGTFSVIGAVTDASGASATATVTFTVALGTPPALTVASITPTLGTQPAVRLTLGGAFPVALSGTLVLTFGSSVGGDDTSVSFTDGTRSVPFSIPAGSTTATFPSGNFGVRLGTVAGTITLRVTQLLGGGNDVTPNPAPQTQIVIPPSAPVITAVTCAASSGGLTVNVTGYTTTRNMLSGTFNFTAPNGSSIASGNNTIQVSLAPAFVSWFATTASNATGGQFLLTQPFSLTQGSTATGITVTAGLGNSVGGSNILPAVTCQ